MIVQKPLKRVYQKTINPDFISLRAFAPEV
jgi:hypothetical protein